MSAEDGAKKNADRALEAVRVLAFELDEGYQPRLCRLNRYPSNRCESNSRLRRWLFKNVPGR